MCTTFNCSICLEDNNDLSKKVILECHPEHIFCYNCIFEWYDKNKNTINGIRCPLCRKNGGVLPLLEPHTEKIKGVHENYVHSNTYGFSGYDDSIGFIVATGPTGSPMYNWPTGPTGPTGYNGFIGHTGYNGFIGHTGYNGHT